MSIRIHLARRRLIGVHIVLSLFTLSPGTPASDTIYTGGNLTDGNTLLSAGDSFTLGFFSPPGEPTKRYLGTWFSFSPSAPDTMAIYWVANRDTPLGDTSGVLVVTTSGNLLLLDGSNNSTVWSSGSTSSTPPMGARLLESGNLVVVQQNNSTAQWQSFDHPCNSLLPGMKIGQNLWNSDAWYLSSWLSATDPGTGSYRYITELGGGTPENVLRDSNHTKKYRTGPWNGERFDGVPEMASYASSFSYQVTVSSSEVTYSYTAKPDTPFSQLRLGDAGVVQRLVWDAGNRQWNSFLREPRDDCDDYAHCGPFALCDRNAASTSLCSCFKGFVPAFPKEWSLREYSGGCRRNISLDCRSGSSTDWFQVVPLVKLPDTEKAAVDMATRLDQCKLKCLANCSCVAYAAADGGSSGCIIWTDSFTDLRFIEKGQDLYLRLPKSLLPPGGKNKKLRIKIVVPVVVGALVLAGIIIFGIIWWRPAALVGHWIDYQILKDGTESFSEKNIIGKGSFGTVYQCELPPPESIRIGVPGGKKKVAVKVLNQSVLNKYERELQVLFQLSHVNLVRLLGYSYSKHDIGYCCNLVGLFACCKKGPLLIYEYVEKKSLDLYIFGEDDQRKQLSWTQRLQIITSIADGVCFLHVHSGRDVIHRDLKPANILLAADLKTPKIADFGFAKHVPDPTASHTPVGPLGYMAPECRNGQTTKKSDVYSFGLVLLEIISGIPNCVELAKRLPPKDLLDKKRVPLSQEEDGDPNFLPRVHRYIQIGLLCVQESPDRRPDISQVLEMLKTEVEIPELEEPTLKEGQTSNTGRIEEPTLKEEGETSDTRYTEEPTIREEGETSNKICIEEPVFREEGETSNTRPKDDDIELAIS